MDDTESVCPVCKDYIADLDHNNTVNHRFHFLKWSYNEYRKALLNDRHGVTVEVEVERINNFNFSFEHLKGKYKIKVTPEQMRLHHNRIIFKCKIKNTRKDPIYVTSTNLLHPSHNFSIDHTYNFGIAEETFLKLLPGASYKCKIIFETNILTSASYKIPLICNVQTVDNKQSFTIVRTFLTIVDDQIETKNEKIKSPFTNQVWTEVKKTVPTTKETSYLDQYKIPGKYLRILAHGLQRFEGMNVNDENQLRELNELLRSLSTSNYARYWHIVLWLEEIAQELMLRKYNMESVKVKLGLKDTVIIDVPGLSEKRPSVIVGDFIKMRLSGDHTAYKGFVCAVNEKSVEISHLDDEITEYIYSDPTVEVDISFMVGRLSFERMHHAVDKVVETRMVEKFFPPNRITVRHHIAYELNKSDFFNKQIVDNTEQKNAVDKILNSNVDYPYIVFGPPGTGKSVTIIEAILQIKKRTKKKILVCAPANSACDMLALKLIPYCSKNELLRIHSSTRERTTITAELAEYSNMVDDEFTKVNIEKLMNYRIIVTTLVLVGRFAKFSYHPDCVFIDEAAQASEPETDIAIALVNLGRQIVLAGDPKQLGPMATKCAEKLGLGKSLLERLMGYDIYQPNTRTGHYDTDFITMLKLNFRSHPDILLIPNELFYDNQLLAMSGNAQRDPLASLSVYPNIERPKAKVEGRAVEFCSLSAKDQREGASPSYFNPFEAQLVIKYVTALINLFPPSPFQVQQSHIGIVTPYKRQVHKIKKELKQAGYSNVEVGTTESFQGREKRIIIISTVRAQHSLLLLDKKYNLGFVKHPQRFNVALTRAISKLIIIGCPPVLRHDDKWTKYMDLCEDYGTYFGNVLPKDNQEFRQDVLEKGKHFKCKDDQYNN